MSRLEPLPLDNIPELQELGRFHEDSMKTSLGSCRTEPASWRTDRKSFWPTSNCAER